MSAPPTAVAIVPAHDEAPRIAAVLAPLLASGAFARVLVVDDGSRDGTADAARAAGADVLRLPANRGKGGALRAGLAATREPLVAFFDADLLGLRPEHAHALLAPVASGAAALACGLRDYGPPWNALQAALPPITGERATTRAVLADVPADFWSGFRIEAGINAAARRAGPVHLVQLWGVTIVAKWEKVGARRGAADAARMVREILLALRDAEAGR